MYESRFSKFLDFIFFLLMGSIVLLVCVGLPASLYFAAVSQQKIINERCDYDYTVRDYFLNGESIATVCGIEQQQIRLLQESDD